LEEKGKTKDSICIGEVGGRKKKDRRRRRRRRRRNAL
jgi:hypothetical protein